MWNGGAPPGVAFTYAPGRGGHHAEWILQGFTASYKWTAMPDIIG
jgi:hypothetical protein